MVKLYSNTKILIKIEYSDKEVYIKQVLKIVVEVFRLFFSLDRHVHTFNFVVIISSDDVPMRKRTDVNFTYSSSASFVRCRFNDVAARAVLTFSRS